MLLLANGDEIAQVPEFHLMPIGYRSNKNKVLDVSVGIIADSWLSTAEAIADESSSTHGVFPSSRLAAWLHGERSSRPGTRPVGAGSLAGGSGGGSGRLGSDLLGPHPS